MLTQDQVREVLAAVPTDSWDTNLPWDETERLDYLTPLTFDALDQVEPEPAPVVPTSAEKRAEVVPVKIETPDAVPTTRYTDGPEDVQL